MLPLCCFSGPSYTRKWCTSAPARAGMFRKAARSRIPHRAALTQIFVESMPAELMSNIDWQETDDFNRMLQHVGATCSTRSQRRIACELARLVFDDLPQPAKKALAYAENMDSDPDHLTRSEQFRDQLQLYLPEDHSSAPCSAVIWALMPSTATYPAWYSASIVACNLVELKAATSRQLCDFIRSLVCHGHSAPDSH